MRAAHVMCMAFMLSGTVGCSAQVPTMGGGDAGSLVAASQNNDNVGDWDGSGNADQTNSATITTGNSSSVSVRQNNEAVGNAAQQIGNGNNISSGGSGQVGRGNSSNSRNVGLWDDSGNTVQSNAATITTGTYAPVRLRQNNEAVGATGQQIGNGNNLSSRGLAHRRRKF